MTSAASSYDPLDARLGRTSGEPVETTKGKPVRSHPPRKKSDAARRYEKSRIVEFSFSIPFGGKPADTCEEMIREHITRSLLNSLSEIHPDIRCSIHTRHQEAIRRNAGA